MPPPPAAGFTLMRAGSTVSVNTAGGAIDVGSAPGMVTASASGAIQVGGARASAARPATVASGFRMSPVAFTRVRRSAM
jgi:hypothetical protein